MYDKANDYIPLAEVPRYIPGRRIHRATAWRWSLDGVKRNGKVVRLRTTVVGGRRYSTVAFIEQFLAECNGTTSASLNGDVVHKRAEDAARLLEARGVK